MYLHIEMKKISFHFPPFEMYINKLSTDLDILSYVDVIQIFHPFDCFYIDIWKMSTILVFAIDKTFYST